MTKEVHINCLGDFEVTGLATSIKGHKQTALLAYLACNLGNPVPRTKLASTFWCDRFDEQARQSLRQALSTLGKAFQACPECLQVDRDEVTLNPLKVCVDLVDAESRAADGKLEQAVSILCRGQFLENFEAGDQEINDWLISERSKWSNLTRQVVTQRAEQLLSNNNPVEADSLLTWSLDQDPFDEPMVRLLMQAKAASGSISGVAQVYRHFEEDLRLDLGVEPSIETKDCFRSLQQVSAPKPDLLDRPALAVLPFKNLSGDTEQEYFVDGLTEDIITELSYWRTFPVIARNSSFVFKGQETDPRTVAEQLGAEFLLEGSVRKSDSRIRIAVQLMNARTSHQLWATKFDRELSDVFELQDDITRSIAAVIENAVINAEQSRLKSVGTRDVGAWDFYLRGVDFSNQFTAQDHVQARNMFKSAINIDPNYAKPFAGIAVTHLQDIALNLIDDHDAAISSVIKAASCAVKLDVNDSSARVCLGTGYMWAREFDRALAEVQQAIESNPSNAFAYVALGNILDVCGEPEQGIPNIEVGLRLNPLEPKRHHAMTWLAGAYLNARRYEEALTKLQNTLSRHTDYPLTHLFKAVCLAHLDKLDEARKSLSVCEKKGPGFIKDFLKWRAYRLDADNEHMAVAIQRIGFPQ